MTETDVRLMRRALELAARGAGQVSPSPLVGCVIARDDGEVVGEGFYLYEGVKHAETLALEGAGARARGATAYVSLEPHAHQGRTPPCTIALIKAGVRRVVAPVEDPNPLVSGRGFAHLREAGIAVEVGLLAEEAARLNEKYIHAMRHARPFVHLKLACSLDGRIATRTGDARWITNEASRARVHELRHEYDAILVGAGTANADDPLLTDRSRLPRHRPLTRLLLDDNLQLSPDSQLARTTSESPLIVFTSDTADERAAANLKARGVEIVRVPGGARDLAAVLENLHERSLQSVLVEGGATVAGMFLEAGLVARVSFFIAPLIIGGSDARAAVAGTGATRIADATRLRSVEITQHGSDVEITGTVTSDG
ncbi:MAG TPA: bifunctional diaminohydroxyphosphoribosylaminopyrimidine deaminase/5-amino-6-(5-phosphoribosylamino)uracil reductase RibD [Pyrinomonadaceae bacterium]|jgi:diaminohydroxyphosphoribosylaminopyrimidine deaminase/5-amino-6-(5-phosphoribosylamino)uracil reductase|nr:bifunctional diaminohydroxyphosphoribosylaminopyrimidine deaminase/5-amino-6-(5-phosphoribosylamino)uracil reductase RibD [Pyrinomonadaceae bacterium]